MPNLVDVFDNTKFGDRLRLERRRLDLTQEQVAVACRVSRNAVTFYESGRSRPDASFMHHAIAAGMDVWYLLTGARASEAAIDQLDLPIFQAVSEAVDEFCTAHDLELPPEKRRGLIKILYRQFSRTGTFDARLFADVMKVA